MANADPKVLAALRQAQAEKVAARKAYWHGIALRTSLMLGAGVILAAGLIACVVVINIAFPPA